MFNKILTTTVQIFLIVSINIFAQESLVYDENNRVIEKQHFFDGTIRSYNKISYDSNGRVVTDSLFEACEIGFVPTQVTLFEYNDDGMLTSEHKYQQFSGEWYLISTVKTEDTGSFKSFNKLSYDTKGRIISDTMFQACEISFVPTQAVVYEYSDDDKVLSINKYQQFSGEWYLISRLDKEEEINDSNEIVWITK